MWGGYAACGCIVAWFYQDERPTDEELADIEAMHEEDHRASIVRWGRVPDDWDWTLYHPVILTELRPWYGGWAKDPDRIDWRPEVCRRVTSGVGPRWPDGFAGQP